MSSLNALKCLVQIIIIIMTRTELHVASVGMGTHSNMYGELYILYMQDIHGYMLGIMQQEDVRRKPEDFNTKRVVVSVRFDCQPAAPGSGSICAEQA